MYLHLNVKAFSMSNLDVIYLKGAPGRLGEAGSAGPRGETVSNEKSLHLPIFYIKN